MSLVPCEGCSRHVREVDVVCPFCGAPAGARPTRGVPRAAGIALAVLGAGISACGGTTAKGAGPTAAPASTSAQTASSTTTSPPSPVSPTSPDVPAQPAVDPNRLAAAYGAPPMMVTPPGATSPP